MTGRYALVAIAGLPGAGTTTLARLLSERLRLPHVYAGAEFRKLAAERGMSLSAFGEYAEAHPEVDTELDRRMMEVARKGGVVLEGRMVAWQCREAGAAALKVLVEAPETVRARRVAVREDKADVEAVLRENRHREASEAKRYREIYGVDPNDPRLYDLVLDSASHLPAELSAIVEARFDGQ